MGLFVMWVAFSIAAAIFASSRGRSGFAWFLVSMIISPLIAFVFIAVMKNEAMPPVTTKTPTSETHVKCPSCAEFVLPEASKCKHCGSELKPDPGYVQRKAVEKQKLEDELQHDTYVGWSIVAGIVLAVYLGIKAFS